MTLEAPAVKTCVTCAHLVGRRVATEFHEGWICGAPENIEGHVLNVVSGTQEAQYFTPQCIAARKAETASCGPEGKWWVLYVRPEYSPASTARARSQAQASNADDLLNQLENI